MKKIILFIIVITVFYLVFKKDKTIEAEQSSIFEKGKKIEEKYRNHIVKDATEVLEEEAPVINPSTTSVAVEDEIELEQNSIEEKQRQGDEMLIERQNLLSRLREVFLLRKDKLIEMNMYELNFYTQFNFISDEEILPLLGVTINENDLDTLKAARDEWIDRVSRTGLGQLTEEEKEHWENENREIEIFIQSFSKNTNQPE